MTQFHVNLNVMPETIYKYRSWDQEKHQDLLNKCEIYFPSMDQINDPFDCKIVPKMSDETAIASLMVEHRARNPDKTEETLLREVTAFRRNQNQQDTMLSTADKMATKFGVFSSTRTKKNLLMWSHYANSHKGFCVGFNKQMLTQSLYENPLLDVVELPVYDAYDVVYTSEYPIVNVSLKDVNWCIPIFTHKHIGWSYEEEVRIIHNFPKATLKINPQAITEIILGLKISSEAESKIIEITKEKFPHAHLLKARKAEDQFAIEFDEIS